LFISFYNDTFFVACQKTIRNDVFDWCGVLLIFHVRLTHMKGSMILEYQSPRQPPGRLMGSQKPYGISDKTILVPRFLNRTGKA